MDNWIAASIAPAPNADLIRHSFLASPAISFLNDAVPTLMSLSDFKNRLTRTTEAVAQTAVLENGGSAFRLWKAENFYEKRRRDISPHDEDIDAVLPTSAYRTQNV